MKILGGRYYNSPELQEMGLSIGKNAMVHETAQLVAFENIRFGNNVRIDPFCVLSAAGGFIELGCNVHLSANACLFGGGGITIESFSGVSPGCRLFSASDTFTGEVMIGATLPVAFTRVVKAPILMEKHTQLGAGSTVLPGVKIAEGSVTGAHTLVNSDLAPWGVYAGIPARLIKPRRKDLLQLAEIYLRDSV